MKQLLTLILITTGFLGNAQDYIEYSYDAAGNRTERRLISSEPDRDNGNTSNTDQYAEQEDATEHKDATTKSALTSGTHTGASIYPNPTTSFVDIDLGSLYASDVAQTFEVIDFNGKVVQRFEISSQSSTLKLDGYRSGIYYIHFKNDGILQESWKVIKIN